jgi:Tol biopolymer transport system component
MPTFNLAEFKREMDSVRFFAVDSPAKRLFFLKGPSERYELEWFDERSRAFRPFLPGISAGDVDFSRDGRWITYVRKPENTLWVAKPDGGQARQINTPGMILIELPRWSPEGKRVAFMGKRAGSPWRIFTVPIVGGEPEEASEGTDNQGAPTWSPDGRRLVYGRVMCQEDRTCAVQEIDLGSRKESMVPGSEGLSTARWSPDGEFIAALRTETHQVFLFRWRSGTWRKVADGANGNDLSWSPDSHTLYTSRPNGNLPEVLRISLHDGKVAPVADLSDFSKLSGRSDTWFAVTPDNSFLFMHIVGGQNVYSLQYSEK